VDNSIAKVRTIYHRLHFTADALRSKHQYPQNPAPPPNKHGRPKRECSLSTSFPEPYKMIKIDKQVGEHMVLCVPTSAFVAVLSVVVTHSVSLMFCDSAYSVKILELCLGTKREVISVCLLFWD
jgi:hypothetical protein